MAITIRFSKAAAFVVLLLLMLCPVAKSESLGVLGTTYPIAEPDALEQIKQRAAGVDWDKVIKAARERIENFKPDWVVKLPKAKQNRTRLVDPTYELEFDVPDGRGGILYPKGYKINPLEYVSWPGIMVIIDATDSQQVKWFEESVYKADFRTSLLLTDGSYYEMSKRFKRPVYYLMPKIAQRLKIEVVPSVVVQNGLNMEVTEIALGK